MPILEHYGSFDASRIVSRLNANGRHRGEGVGYLLWVLIDELLAEMNFALEAPTVSSTTSRISSSPLAHPRRCSPDLPAAEVVVAVRRCVLPSS